MIHQQCVDWLASTTGLLAFSTGPGAHAQLGEVALELGALVVGSSLVLWGCCAALLYRLLKRCERRRGRPLSIWFRWGGPLLGASVLTAVGLKALILLGMAALGVSG